MVKKLFSFQDTTSFLASQYWSHIRCWPTESNFIFVVLLLKEHGEHQISFIAKREDKSIVSSMALAVPSCLFKNVFFITVILLLCQWLSRNNLCDLRWGIPFGRLHIHFLKHLQVFARNKFSSWLLIFPYLPARLCSYHFYKSMDIILHSFVQNQDN